MQSRDSCPFPEEINGPSSNIDGRTGILMLPTVVVNNVIERGGVTPVAVLSTVCSGFVQGSEPDLCSCIETHSKPPAPRA